MAQTKTTSGFWEHYKHPKWQQMRLKALEAAEFQCQSCGDRDKTLHVHHGYYRKGAKPWEYPLESLHVLCEECHEEAHHIKAQLNEVIGHMDSTAHEALLGFARALKEEEARPYGKVRVASYEEVAAAATHDPNLGTSGSDEM